MTAALRRPEAMLANVARVDARARPARRGPARRPAGRSGRRSRTSCSSDFGPPGAGRRRREGCSCARPRAAHVRRGPSARRLPAADVRDRAENDRLIAAAREIEEIGHDDAARVDLDVETSPGRRGERVARTTRETDGRRSRSTSTGRDAPSIETGRRVLRPPADVARPPRPVRPRGPGAAAISRSTSTTRSRTSRSSSAPRSPRRSATGPGSTASATRPCRWTSRSRPRSSTSAAGRTR